MLETNGNSMDDIKTVYLTLQNSVLQAPGMWWITGLAGRPLESGGLSQFSAI